MDNVSLPITGGCLCGGVRFEATGQPIWIGYCHCRMCQQASGGPFIFFVDFWKNDVAFTGRAPAIYRSSSWGERGFCRDCGTPLFFQYRDVPVLSEKRRALIGFTIGCLDDPSPYQATDHMGVESRLANVNIVDDLPCSRVDDDDELRMLREHGTLSKRTTENGSSGSGASVQARSVQARNQGFS